MKYLRWLFWHVVYLFWVPPKDLTACVIRGERLRPPWWKFKPFVWHNDDENHWEIYFNDERDFTRPGYTIEVDCMVGMDSGRVVGLTIHDEDLYVLSKVARAGSPAGVNYVALEK